MTFASWLLIANIDCWRLLTILLLAESFIYIVKDKPTSKNHPRTILYTLHIKSLWKVQSCVSVWRPCNSNNAKTMPKIKFIDLLDAHSKYFHYNNEQGAGCNENCLWWFVGCWFSIVALFDVVINTALSLSFLCFVMRKREREREIEAKMESNIQRKRKQNSHQTKRNIKNFLEIQSVGWLLSVANNANGWTIYMLNEWFLFNGISLGCKWIS